MRNTFAKYFEYQILIKLIIMKNKKFRLLFLGAVLTFALIGCSKDDSFERLNNDSESGIVSNDELTLTYGTSKLNHYVTTLNTKLNLDGFTSANSRATNLIPTYPYLSSPASQISNVITISSSTSPLTYNNAGTYYLPSGASVSNITFNGGNNVTVIIEGEITSEIITNGNAQVFVGPSGKINGKVTMNGGNSNFQNWGIVKNSSGSIQGDIINNNYLEFTSISDINVNGNASITNNCKLIFTGKVNINKSIENKSFINFKGGFHINGSGSIKVTKGSYTKVSGGTFSYDNSISNVDNDFAVLEIINASKGSINSNGSISGKIYVKSIFNATDLKTVNGAIIAGVGQAPVYISESDCTESFGTNPSDLCSIANFNSVARNIASVSSPVINGITLSATDVKVIGNKAYVSYHTNDEIYGTVPHGSVRVFELNGDVLDLKSQADFVNCEFNALEVDLQNVSNRNIYAVGNNLDGSRMFSAPLNTNRDFTTNLNEVSSYKFPSAAGKSISLVGNDLWVAAGNTNGGLFKLTRNQQSNFEVTQSIQISGAKYVVTQNNKQILFALKNGNPYLRIADVNGNLIADYTDTSITLTNRDGKNSIAVDGDYVYVALSEQGVAKYSLLDGRLVGHFVPSNLRKVNGSKVFQKNGLTNAVTTDGCFVYLANGADGVIILDKATFTYASHFNTGLDKSTNFVYASGNYLFVATGRDGLNVIKIK